MVDGIEWVEQPTLRDPVAVLAFEGWNDAADAASKALYYLMEHYDETSIAKLDSEPYINYQETRPLVSIDRTVRQIHWPATGFFGLSLPEHVHDLVLVLGEEPHLRWRGFCADIISVLRELGVRNAVSLGLSSARYPTRCRSPSSAVPATPTSPSGWVSTLLPTKDPQASPAS